MKYISLAIAAAALLVLSGCTSDTTGDGSINGSPQSQQPGYENNQPYQESVIPPQGSGYGLAYDLSGYLLPVKTLQSQSVTKKFYITHQQDTYTFDPTTETLVRYLEGDKDDLNRPFVSVFQGEAPDQKLVERYVVDQNRINVTTYDKNANANSFEQYPRHLQVGGDLLRNQNGACVLKEQIDNFEMDNIPAQAHPNGHYSSVLHVYCGTADGVKIDRYYADGWGQILAIRQEADGSVTYSVFDQNSYQEH